MCGGEREGEHSKVKVDNSFKRKKLCVTVEWLKEKTRQWKKSLLAKAAKGSKIQREREAQKYFHQHDNKRKGKETQEQRDDKRGKG